MSIIKTIIEKIKLKELALLMFLISVTITFLPIKYLEILKIDGIKELYQTQISIVMLLSGLYLVTKFVVYITKLIKTRIYSPKRRAIKYMTKDMSKEEMTLLITVFYDEKTNAFRVSGKIPYDNGLKTPLVFYDIIYLSSSLGRPHSGFSYNLQPYALEFLNRNLKKGNINIQEGTFKLQK